MKQPGGKIRPRIAASRACALAAAALAALPAFAQGPGTIPVTNAFGHPGSSLAYLIRSITWQSFWIIIPFIAIAEILLVFAIFRFRRKPGRKPAKFHENPPLEIAWTVLPLIAVLIVGISSHKVLHFADYGPAPDLSVMVVGHRFFWEYRYPTYNIDFSNKALVVPAGRNINLDITSVDVIHGFSVPALGVQMDAVPGRITHAWFNAAAGHYEGQCYQLCGPLHGEMFIDVDVVPPAQFAQWLAANTPKPLPAAPAPGAAPAKPAAAGAKPAKSAAVKESPKGSPKESL